MFKEIVRLPQSPQQLSRVVHCTFWFSFVILVLVVLAKNRVSAELTTG